MHIKLDFKANKTNWSSCVMPCYILDAIVYTLEFLFLPLTIILVSLSDLFVHRAIFDVERTLNKVISVFKKLNELIGYSFFIYLPSSPKRVLEFTTNPTSFRMLGAFVASIVCKQVDFFSFIYNNLYNRHSN